jgi:hypothetical protein
MLTFTRPVLVIPGFAIRLAGPASAIVDGSKLSWRRLLPAAKAMIARSSPSLARGIVERKIVMKKYLLVSIPGKARGRYSYDSCAIGVKNYGDTRKEDHTAILLTRSSTLIMEAR